MDRSDPDSNPQIETKGARRGVEGRQGINGAKQGRGALPYRGYVGLVGPPGGESVTGDGRHIAAIRGYGFDQHGITLIQRKVESFGAVGQGGEGSGQAGEPAQVGVEHGCLAGKHCAGSQLGAADPRAQPM
jgi:hypothetical protein